MAGDLSQLAPPLAQAVQAMMDDPAVGTLGVSSGWRSEGQQVALREQHCGSSQYDIYQKPSSECSPPTAIPGTSNHEFTLNGQPWALAVDLDGDLNGAHEVMGKYNLHTPVTGEPWHFELINTAAIKKLVAAGGTPAASGALTVPGVGDVPLTSSTAQNASGPPADWAVRIAAFVGGLVLLGVGLFMTLQRSGATTKNRSGALDQAGPTAHTHTAFHNPTTSRRQDLTDDGGSSDDGTGNVNDGSGDPSAAPAGASPEPGGGAALVAAP